MTTARQQRQRRRAAIAQKAAQRAAAGRNAPGLVRWRRWRRRAGDLLLRVAAPVLLRLLARTWRVQRTGEAGLALLRSDGPWLGASWHGRMLCLMPLRWHAHRGIHVLVSPSDDGGLAVRALARLGYRVIRGSLSRGGASAVRAMSERLRDGAMVFVTPDGPRGPRHSFNSGVAWLARATGAPILTFAVAVDRAWRLRSWDRFTIPKPFARIVVHYGDPLRIDGDTDDAAVERIGERLRERIVADELAAFAHLGTVGDHGEAARG